MDNSDQQPGSLSERIRQAEAGPKTRPAAESGGRNIGVDFVGSIVICGIVGALADRAFKTSPWFLLGMVLFGFGVGIYSAWRAIQKPESRE
jgi:F0F1-type ATP synthase assembly protein I